jgi:hypothetical protein
VITLIGNDKFVAVFGSVPAGDDTLLTQIAANAVREGFHIVLCAPGTDIPVCTLPVSKQKQDHECGTAHVLSLESLLGPPLDWPLLDGEEPGWEPKDRAKVRAKVQAIINRVTKQHDGVKPNIGVIPGPSGYVVVPSTMLLDGEGFSPTVRIGRTALWYWFTLPSGVDLGPGEMTLVPPSRFRVHGTMELIGQTSPAPAWLLERINA